MIIWNILNHEWDTNIINEDGRLETEIRFCIANFTHDFLVVEKKYINTNNVLWHVNLKFENNI